MKRSGGVTAAAIVLIFGSGLLVLLALMMVLLSSLPKAPPENGTTLFVAAAMYGFLAAWGIATAVGILRLYQWARYSILIMGGFALCCLVLGLVGLALVAPMIENQPGIGTLPPHFTAILLLAFGVCFLPPAGISIWWLGLFTRKSVCAQFQAAPPPQVSQSSATADVAVAAIPEPPEVSARKIPVSVRLIAIISLAFSSISLLSLPLVIHTRMSTNIILGVLITNVPVWLHVGVVVLVQVGLSSGVLKKKAWTLDGMLAFLLFSVLNGVLFVMSPARDRFLDAVISNRPIPPNISAEAMKSFVGTLLQLSMVFGVLLSGIALYFLWTRREAYRAACAASGASPVAAR